MASSVTCDMCQQETAQTMQTNVQNGDVLAVGANCLLIFHLTVAAEMLEQLPAENRAAYAPVVAPIVERLEAGVKDVPAAAATDNPPMPTVEDGPVASPTPAADAAAVPVPDAADVAAVEPMPAGG